MNDRDYILLGILLWLLWPKAGSTDVVMTDSEGNPITQDCWNPGDGSVFQVPVASGCPDGTVILTP